MPSPCQTPVPTSANQQARPAFFDPTADYGEVEADLDTIEEWGRVNGVKPVEGRIRISDTNHARAKEGLPRFKVVPRVLNGAASERASIRAVLTMASRPAATRAPAVPSALPDTEAGLIDLVTSYQGTITADVTPQLAGWLLDLNTANRPMTGRGIDRFITILRDAKWMNTGEPVIVSQEGILNDGQHRLTAIRRSGITANMDLRFGIARAAFAATGTGTRRTTGNVLAIAGKPNPTMQSAIGRLLVHHQAGQMHRANQQVEPHQVIAAVDAEPLVAEIAELIRPMKFAPVRTAPIGFVLVLAARAANLAQAATFARLLDDGRAEEEDATRRLHIRLRDAAMAKERLHQIDVAVLAIRAWNAWIARRPIQLLRVSEADKTGDGFPKLASPAGGGDV